MNHIWVGERVAEIESEAIFRNVINRRDAPKWGPNAQFRYPMNGTGHIWVRIFEQLPKARKTPDHPELAALAAGDNGAADHSRFKHQTVNLVGVGIWGTEVPSALDGVHWVYFPEDEYIFYR